MQTKIIELKQAPVVLVEIPDHYRLYTRSDGSPFCTNIRNMSAKVVWQYDGKYIGILSDLTEEQFSECVGGKDSKGFYMCYNYPESNWFETAKQSFVSLLQYENVYTRNPLQEWYDNSNLLDEVSEKDMTLRYQEAQSRTIDPKRTVVLIRKEETK